MKHNYPALALTALLFVCCTISTYAQQLQSPQKVEKLKQFYNAQKNPEISLDRFLKIHQRETLQGLAAFSGCSYLDSACANGDFESGIDPTQWQGAYGVWGTGDPDPAFLTDGILASTGDLFDYDAHHTIVGVGTDYFTGIKTVPDSGGTSALRLGNAINGEGTELISKTIKVTAANSLFNFSYAVVFQDPGHLYEEQPAFSVRAFDCATGQELTGVCDLGNGTYKVVSDASNPFFQSLNDPSYGLIAYRDWTSSYVDLSAYIGRTVNIIFTNKDCALSGHFGYTYFDRFCGTPGGGEDGFVRFGLNQPDTCGKGSICVDYGVGEASDGTTGTVMLNLNVYQNGTWVTTVSSGTLTSDSATYCFAVDPASLGLDNSLGGFDYTITGDFELKGFQYSQLLTNFGTEGQVMGPNNDYWITCGPPDTSCSKRCVVDSYGFKWNLCVTTSGTNRWITGTVTGPYSTPASVWGTYSCNTGWFELHAVNPAGDNCASGYTDSFMYRGYSPFKCNPLTIHVGGARWKSYCAGNVSGSGLVALATCGSFVRQSTDVITPARSGGADAIALKVSPNPVQNNATVSFKLAKESKVNVVVYNYMMQPVKTLFNGTKSAGNQTVTWDARQSNGNAAGSGLYKIVAIIDGKSYTTTVQVVK